MELSSLWYTIAFLACPIGMGAMMWMMNKQQMSGKPGRSMGGEQTSASASERLAALRMEREVLEAEIAEVSRLVELEAQRDALLGDRALRPDSTDAVAVQGAEGGRG